MASDPYIRNAVVVHLKGVGGHVEAESMRELRDKLKLTDFSVTQFSKAVRSLRYKYGLVSLYRSSVGSPGEWRSCGEGHRGWGLRIA